MIKKVMFGVMAVLLGITVVSLVSEGVIRLKNLSMGNYDVEMWRYARELKTRSANPVLGHEHISSSQAMLQLVPIRINEWGLRGAPVVPRSQGGRRILILGSSITFGWGVEEEKTLSALLSERFRADGQENVEVLNAGIGNYNTERYVERYLTKLVDLKPTDIIVHYFVNDAEKLESGSGNALLENSQLALTLWIAINRFIYSGGDESLVEHYRSVYQEDQSGYRAMVASLEKLAAHAKKDGIRLYLAMIPDVHNLTDYPFEFIHERMRKLVTRTGMRYIDLKPSFANLSPEDVWAMPGDPHPNALGHKLMADQIYPVLNTP